MFGALACTEPATELVVSVEAAPIGTVVFGQPATHIVRLRNTSTESLRLWRCDTAVGAYIDQREHARWSETGSFAVWCLGIYPSLELQLAPGAEYISPIYLESAGAGTLRVRILFRAMHNEQALTAISNTI